MCRRGLQCSDVSVAFPLHLWLLPCPSAAMAVARMRSCKAEPARTCPSHAARSSRSPQPPPTAGREDHDEARGHPRLHAGDDDGVSRQAATARLDGIAPGDLVTATLVRRRQPRSGCTDLHKTGHGPISLRARDRCRSWTSWRRATSVPDDPLVDQAGATRRLSDWRGRALAVTFVYTMSAAGLLPADGSAVRRPAARHRSRTRAARIGVHLVSVSFDPASRHAGRDRGARQSARRRSARLELSHGHAEPRSITSPRGSAYRPSQSTDTPESITHNLRTAVDRSRRDGS